MGHLRTYGPKNFAPGVPASPCQVLMCAESSLPRHLRLRHKLGKAKMAWEECLLVASAGAELSHQGQTNLLTWRLHHVSMPLALLQPWHTSSSTLVAHYSCYALQLLRLCSGRCPPQQPRLTLNPKPMISRAPQPLQCHVLLQSSQLHNP